MIAAIRAELRKLFSIRSTYVLLGISLLIATFIGLYVLGYRAAFSASDNPGLGETATLTVMQFVAFFVALAGILLVTHEYRYNTIIYTLLAARRRWQVWAAKIIAVSTFAIISSLVIALLTPLLLRFGLHLQGSTLAPQTYNFWNTLLHAVVYGWAYSMIGLSLAMIIRSQVGTIVTIVIFPFIGEALLSLVLRDNVKYLPFNILAQFLNSGSSYRIMPGTLSLGVVTLVMSGYIITGWLIGLLLLVRRDAN